MSDTSPRRFRALVEQHFGFLEAHGFRRSPVDEHESPVAASVAYVGKHVGFLVTLDTRDLQVDLRVARARDGRLVETGEGGYSRDLLSHLVAHAGHRGGFGRRAQAGPAADPLERMVEDWAELLRTHGAALLSDDERALPPE